MNTTSSVTPIKETPKPPQQRQTAKDIIAANVKSLIEQLVACRRVNITMTGNV